MSNLDYTALPTMAKFHASKAFVRGVKGPIGSGKSVGCVMEMLKIAMEQEPFEGVRRTRFAVVRNTYRELEDTTIRTFKDWIPQEFCSWLGRDMSCIVRFNDVEAEFMFRALDRPDDVKKLLSLELTAAWVNEAKEVPRSVIDMLQGRVGRFPSKRAGGPTSWCLFMDTNPPDNDSWWYELFEEKLPDEWELFSQPSGMSDEAENTENLPERYYHRMMQGKSQEWIDIYVHGNYGFLTDGKPIYPEYQDAIHTIEGPWKPMPGIDLHVGIDFGLTPAAIFGQRQSSGQMVWFDEIISDNLGAVKFAEILGQHCREKYGKFKIRFTGDPAGDQRSQVDERTPFDVLNAAGIPADPASTNDFELRTSAVKKALTTLTMMGTPGLVLVKGQVPQCRKGMMGGYAYKRVQVSGTERFHDKPDKTIYSHVCDAGQYLMDGAGYVDKVIASITPERPVRITASRAGMRRNHLRRVA